MSTRHRLRLAIIFSGSFIARATRKTNNLSAPVHSTRQSRCMQTRKTKASRDGYCTRDNRNNGGQGTMLSVRFELGLETEITVTFSASNVSHRLCPFYVPTLLLKHGEKRRKKRNHLDDAHSPSHSSISAGFRDARSTCSVCRVSIRGSRGIGSTTAKGAFNFTLDGGSQRLVTSGQKESLPKPGNRRVYNSLRDSCVTLT